MTSINANCCNSELKALVMRVMISELSLQWTQPFGYPISNWTCIAFRRLSTQFVIRWLPFEIHLNFRISVYPVAYGSATARVLPSVDGRENNPVQQCQMPSTTFCYGSVLNLNIWTFGFQTFLIKTIFILIFKFYSFTGGDLRRSILKPRDPGLLRSVGTQRIYVRLFGSSVDTAQW